MAETNLAEQRLLAEAERRKRTGETPPPLPSVPPPAMTPPTQDPGQRLDMLLGRKNGSESGTPTKRVSFKTENINGMENNEDEEDENFDKTKQDPNVINY